MNDNILNNLNHCSKQDLIEIHHTMNCWNWDDRLGEKPDNWDDIPNFVLNKSYTLPTKRDIVSEVLKYIESKVRKKELYKYHHLQNCGMTKIEHEIWWIKYKISKILRFFGIYSRKNEAMLQEILTKVAEMNHEKWVKKTYREK